MSSEPDFRKLAVRVSIKIGRRCVLDGGWFDVASAAAHIEPLLRQMYHTPHPAVESAKEKQCQEK